MRENELRIGNYYQWYADGRYYYFKVDNDFFMDINTINNSEPIPLTEDILLKCGFEKRDHKRRGKELSIALNDEYYLVFDPVYDEFYTTNDAEYEDHLGMYLENIKHLHQLQNLYWCLSGKELECLLF